MKIQVKFLKIGIIILGLFFLCNYGFCFAELTAGKTKSNTITLDPLEEHAESFKLHDDDTLYISGEVTSGTVDMYIFDSENYIERYYYEVSWDGLTSTFSREFDALWTDTFYVVLYNPSTTNSASVSYTYEHNTEYLTNLIINLSVTGVLLGTIIVTNFLGKKWFKWVKDGWRKFI